MSSAVTAIFLIVAVLALCALVGLVMLLADVCGLLRHIHYALKDIKVTDNTSELRGIRSYLHDISNHAFRIHGEMQKPKMRYPEAVKR